MQERGAPEDAVRNDLAEELSRRDFLVRAGSLGLGAFVLSAVPAAAQAPPGGPAPIPGTELGDATLQAFFDTIIPGRPASVTELGNPIHPGAIAGVDPEPGAVEADALLLAQNPRIGFDTLVAPFLAELELRSLNVAGATFFELGYDDRERVGIAGLDFSNPTRAIWEAAAAIPFTAFCAAANIPDATDQTSVGYAVMGHPGTAPGGYGSFSYRRRLNRGRTIRGSLP